MSFGEVATLPLVIGLLGFGGVVIAYTVLAAFVVSARPGTVQARWLVATLLVSAAWGALMLAGAWRGPPSSEWLPAIDAARITAWILFLGVLLTGSANSSLGVRVGRSVMITAAALAGAVILISGWAISLNRAPMSQQFVLVPMLSLPILALLSLEQVFRNATLDQRAFLKPLSVALGIVFAVDLFAYSQAAVFSSLSPNVWLLRGIVGCLVAPVLLLAIRRQPDWGEALFISRQAVFYTTGLIGAGAYLLAMGIGGFMLGSEEDVWGAPIQLAFLACTGAVFLYALFSADVRRHFKVFVSKHFFRDRYDYRAEWLRLTRTLAEQHHDTSLAERSLNALTAIISSPGGELWLSRAPQGGFDRRAVSSDSPVPAFIADDDEMVRFLRQTFWVVDTPEYAMDPEKYTNAFAPDSPWLKMPSIVVPLIHERRLVGIVRLTRPALLGRLDFKDHDLLKTAGQQVAVFLAQERSQEQLSETRQFEAFSKLTTFLMHDLKNLIAQQELVVGNAHRFRHRPAFIDDAFNTIESSVKRMRRLLERLQQVTERDNTARIELHKLARDACAACGDRLPKPQLTTATSVVVTMDREKLNMILTHAIRNSQDATSEDGCIDVRVTTQGPFAILEVEDDGSGMDADFIREELFKPFSSTKGAQGMGIGAYQIRETVHAAGGEIEIASAPGQGTLLRMKIPLVKVVDDPGAEPAVPDTSAASVQAPREMTRF